MTEYARLNVHQLSTFTRNPRRGAISLIAESLVKHGQYRPIVGNKGLLTGRPFEVLAGNHTLLAARELGWSEIDVWLIDVDDATCKRIVAADNRLADLGGYDDLDLFELLDGIDDLSGTGYDDSFVEQLRRDLFPDEPLTDPDDAPAVRDDPISESGQLWMLGPHRLLVGDATDIVAVRRLVGDRPPDVVWTDPPYGVDYVGKTADALMIQNDSIGGLAGLLGDAFTVAAAVCRPGAPVYVAHADTERIVFESAMTDAGMKVRQNLIWVKNTMVMGHADYHYKHEPILYGFTPGGDGRLGRGGQRWFGDNSQTTVFSFDKPARSAVHPTMKPVALIDAMRANSLPFGGVVFDPFAGSGSTLIAAQGRGARCFCLELDPRYADVILHRFEAHTGIVPTIDGLPLSFCDEAVPA